jgi:predicted pyridoxine 5'-phosphate oxidase superfamily flavin-nucleotide-binding protein
MKPPTSDIAFTPAVKTIQEQKGSRRGYEAMESRGSWSDTITPDLAAFVAERDSFYVGTATAEGQPYIQHRGGPKGFLKVLDDQTLGFADFRGNLQYISTGNARRDDRVALFFMDYKNRQRLKLMARAEIVDADEHPELLAQVEDPDYRARIERVVLFRVEAFDWNCPQHITPRYTEAELAPVIDELRARIAELEAESSTHSRKQA